MMVVYVPTLRPLGMLWLQVASVVGRADVLAGLLFLCAILTYRRILLSTKKWLWLFVFLLCVLSSALSKEIGVMSAAVCLLYEYFIHNKVGFCNILQFSLSLFCFQVSLPALLPLLHKVWKGQPPSWFKPFAIRVVIICVCVIVFLIFRLRLNQGSPKFTE